VNNDSCECVTSSLDLFSVLPTQTAVEVGNYVDYHPITNVTNGSPIEFDIPASGTDYIDLSKSMLYLKAKVVQQNGHNLPPNTLVPPVNLWLHSLFNQVDISLNGTTVTTANDTYAY